MSAKLKVCLIGSGKLLEIVYAHLLSYTAHELYVHMPESFSLSIANNHCAAAREKLRAKRSDDSATLQGVTILTPHSPIEGYDVYWVCHDDVIHNGLLPTLATWLLESTGDKPVIFSSPLTPDATNSLCNFLGSASKLVYYPVEHYPRFTLGRNISSLRRGYIGAVDPSSASELIETLGVSVPDVRCVSLELAAKTYLARQYRAMMSQIMENEIGDILGCDYLAYSELATHLSANSRMYPHVGFNDDSFLKTMPILRQTYSGDDVLYSTLHSTVPRKCDVIVERVQKAWRQAREKFPGEIIPLYLYGVTSEVSGSDVDHSYAMELLLKLLQWSEGVNVYVIDPHVDVSVDNRLLQYRMIKVEESYEKKACRVVLVDHPEFKDGHDLDAFNLVYSGLHYKPTLF